MAAAHHATTTGNAGSALRAFATEEWIRDNLPARHTLGRFEHRSVSAIEGVTDADRVSNLLQQTIRRTKDPILDYAQHARSGVIVLRHLALPVGEAGP